MSVLSAPGCVCQAAATMSIFSGQGFVCLYSDNEERILGLSFIYLRVTIKSVLAAQGCICLTGH